MKYTQEEKGITLVALVVTIIIMLILTAVTLSATIGKNGLIESAMNARAEESKKEALDEVISGIKRLEYYEQASSDRGVIAVNIYTIANLQKYLEGRVNGIRTAGSGKLTKITAVYYTNRNGTFTIFFNENGGTKIEKGFVIENNQENTVESEMNDTISLISFELEMGENISLTSLNEEVVSWGVPDEYKDIIQINETTGVVTRTQEGNAQIYGILEDETRITINIEDKNIADEIENYNIYVFYYEDINTLVFNNENEGLQEHQLTESWNNIDDLEAFENFARDRYAPWYKYRNGIQTITFLNKIKPRKTAWWFYSLTKLTNINNIEKLDTSSVTNMNGMFYMCISLTTIDLSNFKTSKVMDMNGMFYGISLTTIDLSKFNTSNVTDMAYMFGECTLLNSLDLSSFNTSKVTNMEAMFIDCENLADVNLRSFNTSNVTNMIGMFDSCINLTNLDLSSFNTGNVTNMATMFNGCEKITNLDLSNFNTSNVTNMATMFGVCRGLTNLDLSNFNTSNVTNMSGMFRICGNLKKILVNQNWQTASNNTNMFEGCGVQEVTVVN